MFSRNLTLYDTTFLLMSEKHILSLRKVTGNPDSVDAHCYPDDVASIETKKLQCSLSMFISVTGLTAWS